MAWQCVTFMRKNHLEDTDIVEELAGRCDVVLANFFSLARPWRSVRITNREKLHHHTTEPAIAGFCLRDGRHGERR